MRRFRHHRNHAQALALPLRQWISRLALVLMIAACVGLMVVSKTAPDIRSRIATPVVDTFSPALDVLSRPVEAFTSAKDWFSSLFFIYAQNAQLRETNQRLLQWQNVALQLEAENNALRELLNYNSEEKLRFTTAKVVSDRGGPFARTAVINVGENQGLKRHQPIVNAEGLVGRITEVGDHSAQVLLLTDINSKIPVLTADSRERAIAAGDNTSALRLNYLPQDSKVTVGEKIITSSDGDTLPEGLTVGEVTSIEGGVVTVKPYVSWQRLDFVSAIHRENITTK